LKSPFELRLDEIKQTIEVGGERFVHFFRPPAFEDWRAYNAALEDGREQACALLWERIIMRVEGYEKSRIPSGHRAAAAIHLTVCEPSDVDEARGFCAVSLVTGATGEPLVHVFRRPVGDEMSEVRRIHAAWLRRCEAYKKENMPLPNYALPLYSELIAKVHGYVVNGKRATREHAVQFMDNLHRLAALKGLVMWHAPAEEKSSAA